MNWIYVIFFSRHLNEPKMVFADAIPLNRVCRASFTLYTMHIIVLFLCKNIFYTSKSKTLYLKLTREQKKKFETKGDKKKWVRNWIRVEEREMTLVKWNWHSFFPLNWAQTRAPLNQRLSSKRMFDLIWMHFLFGFTP